MNSSQDSESCIPILGVGSQWITGMILVIDLVNKNNGNMDSVCKRISENCQRKTERESSLSSLTKTTQKRAAGGCCFFY